MTTTPPILAGGEAAGDRRDLGERTREIGEVVAEQGPGGGSGDSGEGGRGIHRGGGADKSEIGFKDAIDARRGHRSRQGDRDALAAGRDDDAAGEAHVGVGRGAKLHGGHAGGNAREEHRLGGADDGNARGSEQIRLLVGDAFERAETLGMFDIHIEDEGDVGSDDGSQAGDFAALVGAAFEHGSAMRSGQGEDGHGDADEVVEITGCGKNVAEERASHGGGQFLGGGFAGGPADRDGGQGTQCAHALQMKSRERSKRGQRIVNLEARDRGVGAAAFDDRGSGATSGGGGEEIVAVADPAQGDEEVRRGD